MKHEYCVFIGRFSPFSLAHKSILDEALKVAENVIVVIGSANSPRTDRNPWTELERQIMIEICYKDYEDRIHYVHARDYTYNNGMWVSTIQQKVKKITNSSEDVVIIGFASDETSYYLNDFPQWQYIEFNTEFNFHATDIRNLYFAHDVGYKNCVPEKTVAFLELFKTTEEFKNLKQSKDYNDNYMEAWRGSPHTPIFTTVDCLVLKSSHILLVKRRFNPGKGLYALPGGFLKATETLEDGALRELKEETKIKINTHDLRKSIVDVKVYDSPKRDPRSRVITNAFLINLGNGDLPEVKAGSDAAEVHWLPLGEFYEMEKMFFSDHYHIIMNLVSKF
jgi:bifunctional NMN adenylyltransferase/nudix hydrolase